MEKQRTIYPAAAAGMICAGCACALMASGGMGPADGLVTAAAMAAALGLERLARRYLPALAWLGEALFCGIGWYAATQLLSLGEFGWTSAAEGPLHELGALWVAAACALLYALGGARFAALGTGAAAAAFGAVNYALIQFRGRQFMLIDLGSLRTALNVSGSYELELTAAFALGLIYALAFGFWAWRLFPGGKTGRVSRLISRALPLAGAVIYAYLCLHTGLMYRNGIYMNWNDNEFRASSVMYFIATASTLDIEEPEGYGDEALDEIGARLLENAAERDALAGPAGERPDIIAVMSESFSDSRELGGFETDESFLDFFDAFADESIHGHVYSSVIGGNTANSEFEFLTGDTMAFLPSGSVAYQTYINYPTGSLVSTLKAQGYSALSFHPYWKSGWNRTAVYERFGFDESVWLDDYTGYDRLRGYPTDEWNYERLIELYEAADEARAPGESLFIFNITMQNHGGYTSKNVESEVHVSGREGEFPVTEQYLTLIRLTDVETREFIDYLRALEREVVVLFFGDHQPKLEKGFYDLVYGHDSGELQLSEFERQYITPFYIWSNKGLEARNEGYTSINYLSQLLLETVGLHNTPYGYFLSELQSSWPAINAYGAMDASGRWHYLSDEAVKDDELLRTYRILQYNRLFDPAGCRNELYYLS